VAELLRPLAERKVQDCCGTAASYRGRASRTTCLYCQKLAVEDAHRDAL